MSWFADAKCRGRDPRDWDLGGRRRADAEAASRTLCRGCPVVAECALDAAAGGDAWVIRAGVCLWPRTTTGGQRPEDTRHLIAIAHRTPEK